MGLGLTQQQLRDAVGGVAPFGHGGHHQVGTAPRVTAGDQFQVAVELALTQHVVRHVEHRQPRVARRGEDARRPCAGATDTKYQEDEQE